MRKSTKRKKVQPKPSNNPPTEKESPSTRINPLENDSQDKKPQDNRNSTSSWIETHLLQNSQAKSDLVLSDIHIHSTSPQTTFILPTSRISINHGLATTLPLVGLQIWAGALVMSEYMIWKQHLFSGKGVLEVGAGTGLVSLVAGTRDVGAKKVIATDIHVGPDEDQEHTSAVGCKKGGSSGVLSLLKENAISNEETLGNGTVHVRELDLIDDTCPLFQWPIQRTACKSIDGKPHDFQFTKEDMDWFHDECSIIIGADIIYVDFVTFHLVKRLPVLLLKTQPQNSTSKKRKVESSLWESRVLYLALEKRVQFCKNECRVAIPAWEFLVRTIDAMNLDLEGRIQDDGEDMDGAFPDVRICMDAVDLQGMPQLFDYERNKELEIHRLYLSFP
ncbi:hypothetical protein BDR26DRAFT_856680 [Obelidium mucronatum]|nr:hypothetical protein BDR26DRAFT_856680 [Obelidium mucronatum]